MHPRPKIPESDRIPTLQKFAFSFGGGFDAIATQVTFGVIWMPIFNIGMGIPIDVLGYSLMIMRLVDAFYDPVIGNISDNARTRWGRRRPFIFFGAIVTGLMFPIFWYLPAGWGSTAQIAYLTIAGLLYHLAYTFWAMPYYGLHLELTPNYDERTRLSAWMAIVGKIMGLAGGWVMAFLTCSWFVGADGKSDIVGAIHSTWWVFSVVIILFGVLPALFVKERYYDKESSHQPRESLWNSVKESASCRPLWILIAISFFVVVSGASVGNMGYYINVYYVNGGKDGMHDANLIEGWKSVAMLGTGILSVPVWTWLSEKFDKTQVVVVILCGGIVGHLLNFFCLVPGNPYLQLIPAAFYSAIPASFWLILGSMKADVSDYDELQTGKRREGSINSFYSISVKVALAVGLGISGLLMNLAGYDQKIDVQTDEVLHRMIAIYLLVPTVVMLAGVGFMLAYKLNRKRMTAIRAELEARRGAL